MPRTRASTNRKDAETQDAMPGAAGATVVAAAPVALDDAAPELQEAAPPHASTSDESPVAPGALDPAALAANIEAALFTAQRPMALGRLCQTLIEAGMDERTAAPANVKAAITTLNEAYETGGRAFRIEAVAGGFRVMTLGAFAPIAASVRGMTESTRLSRAAIETLAIIAYRQPITRVDVESIRGSATGEVLRTLLDKRLVTIVGRAEELGRPMLYGTTKRFLEVFGLASLRDLPSAGAGGLALPVEAEPASAEAEANMTIAPAASTAAEGTE
ncbi:MAG: SMC-Scp complex subunit ScpB [Phycisphaerales bacterium]